MNPPRPRGRPRKHPEAPAASVSRNTLKILGKRVFGRKDCMPGVIVRIGDGITQEQADWAVSAGVAVWLGDAQGELDAISRRAMNAVKSAAESTMARHDKLSPEERAEAHDAAPEEGMDR